jgi:hypothetical protein
VAIWTIIKAVVSVASASFAAMLLLLFVHRPEYTFSLGAAAAFLFLAAIPWLDLTRPTRGLSLAGVVVAFGFLLVASRPFTQAADYPLNCTTRRVWCEFENLLFTLGGAPLAALPFAVLGLGLLAVSLRSVWNHRQGP